MGKLRNLLQTEEERKQKLQTVVSFGGDDDAIAQTLHGLDTIHTDSSSNSDEGSISQQINDQKDKIDNSPKGIRSRPLHQKNLMNLKKMETQKDDQDLANTASEVLMMQEEINQKRRQRKWQPTVVRRNTTLQLFKTNIDDKIKQIRKYSKWLILMQLPMIEPDLSKYCNFDYNALLIKRRIKTAVRTGPTQIMVEKHEALFKTFDSLHGIPEDFKSTPYKMQLEGHSLDRSTFSKLTFEIYCKCFGFKRNQLYSDLDNRVIAEVLRKNIRVAVLEYDQIIPYHFFRPKVNLVLRRTYS